MLSLEDADALEAADLAVSEQETDDADSDAPTQAGDQHYLVDNAWDEDERTGTSTRDRLISALAIIAILSWSAFCFWVRRDAVAEFGTPSIWASSVFEWVVPVLLVAIVWQLAIRTGRAEQQRFANTAALLSRESAELEARLSVVNRELSLARDFIASQSRDLESLGRVSTERISANAEKLQALISDNGERVDTIGRVSDTALANMEKLRDQLPVLANSARDMTNQIGNAGNVAERHVAALTEALGEVEKFGEAGEEYVAKINAAVAGTLETFDRQAVEIGDGALATFEHLNRQSEDFSRQMHERDVEALAEIKRRSEELTEFLENRNGRLREIEEASTSSMRDRIGIFVNESNAMLASMVERRNETATKLESTIGELEKRLVETINRVSEIDQAALENARKRLTGLADEANRLDANVAESAAAFDADLERRREAAREFEDQALTELQDRLARFDRTVSEREQGHLAKVEGLAERSEEIAARLTQIDEQMGQLGTRFDETSAGIGESADLLTARLNKSTTLLGENGSTIARLTEEGVRLLEIIRSTGQHAEGDLQQSIARAETRLTEFQSSASQVRELIEQAESRSVVIVGHVEAARDHGANTLGMLERIESQLSEIAGNSRGLAEQTRGELQQAIDMLTMTASNVLQDLREGQTEAIREVAGKIAEHSNSAIASALEEEAKATIATLEEASRRAAEAGRETTIQLRDQLAKVNELTSNLEQRVAVARERAEEEVDHDFTRRMALITEALNSSAIDISRAFDNEVADTQWANYLRGDRGIFTRRAVSLLDKQEARAVFDIYEEDSEFRETVNRYIHDFEAMLRSVLSTRDGNAIAVTLLSSDVGKLYVVLAQAIDRLRD